MIKKLFMITIFLCFHTHGFDSYKVLIFGGKNGWIGQKVVTILKDMGHLPFCAESRLENREAIIREIECIDPDYIINAAGIIGNPNVDWCETHKQETIRTNVIGTLNLADIAYTYNIHINYNNTGLCDCAVDDDCGGG